MSPIERRGNVVAPEGTFDFPRDTVSGPARTELENQRDVAADRYFEQADLPEIADTDSGWTRDGIFWSKGIYWENEDQPSLRGSFGVEFCPDTAKIVGDWANY
jgi:hypothetical protein